MMRRGLLFVAMAAFTAIASPTRAETLGFVLTHWHNAGQFTPDGIVECPKGFNADNAPFQEGKGTVSNGFNLDGSQDGRASASTCRHEKFSAPNAEKGIDNQLYRAQACIRSARPDDPADTRTNSEIVTNGINRWLVEVTGVDDVVNDDHVEVTLAHGLDKLTLDANGKFIPGSTQRIDEAASAYVFHTTGRIVKGTLVTEPIQGLEIGQHTFLSARLKMDLTPDGARGVIGGSHDVERLYRTWTKTSGPMPLFYTALQRSADAAKDSKTGKCTAISAAYDLEFVRAFILHKSLAVIAEKPSTSVPHAALKPEPKSASAPAPVRLITEAQYLNSLRAIFGDGLTYPVKFARVHRVGGLIAVGTSAARITSGLLDQFDAAARTIAAQVVSSANRTFLIPCRPQAGTSADDACAQQFLKHVGPLLFRRPLTSGERAAYGAIAHESAEKFHDFYEGLGVSLASLLVAPDFLHVLQPIDSTNRLTAYAKASRLSLLLWNAYPDEELLAAAQNGSLNTPAGLAAQVERMIASPRLESGVRNFFEDMLMFENFETLTKDAKIYPAFTRDVQADAREQTLRTLVAHVVRDDADYRDIFTTRKTFLTDSLGAFYGVKVGRTHGWAPYEFPPENPRAGLLTQASFLALYAQPGRSSPTRRGKAIREIFLCQAVPNAPPNVNFSKLEDPGKVYRTSRERLDAHRSNPVCAGCHKITDPIGLALENFDGAGAYRTEETRTRIDASGQLDDASFADVNGLGQAMHDNPKAARCLAQRLASYALGRTLKTDDDAWLAYINSQFAADGYRVKELLRTIALSDAFYAASAPARKKQGP